MNYGKDLGFLWLGYKDNVLILGHLQQTAHLANF